MPNVRHSARHHLKRLSLREKLLFLLFVLVVLVIWTSSLFRRSSECLRSIRQAQSDLEIQRQWLERSDQYAEGLARALERVDPSKTYSAAQLSGRIDNLLRQVSLAASADIDPVRSREGEIFNDHDIRVRLSRISIAQLIEFNSLLGKETPYINLQSVRLTANRRNPEELDARFEINSFELKNPEM